MALQSHRFLVVCWVLLSTPAPGKPCYPASGRPARCPSCCKHVCSATMSITVLLGTAKVAKLRSTLATPCVGVSVRCSATGQTPQISRPDDVHIDSCMKGSASACIVPWSASRLRRRRRLSGRGGQRRQHRHVAPAQPGEGPGGLGQVPSVERVEAWRRCRRIWAERATGKTQPSRK